MTTTSSVSNDVRETGKEAREARKVASETSGDIQNELQTLRVEYRRLAEQVGDIIADKGSAAWRRAHPSVDGVVSDAQEKGREAIDAVRDLLDKALERASEILRRRRNDLDAGADLLLKRQTVTADDFPTIRSANVQSEPRVALVSGGAGTTESTS